jgi:hypothetical protein
LRRLAILLAAVAVAGGLAVAAPAPAEAASDCSTRTIGGGSSRISLTVCKGDSVVGDNAYRELSILYVGPTSTRATRCSLSQWTRLYRYGSAWNGPATIHDCTIALRKGANYNYLGNGSRTTATAMIAHSCVTFFYGSVKGSPYCWESHLADV